MRPHEDARAGISRDIRCLFDDDVLGDAISHGTAISAFMLRPPSPSLMALIEPDVGRLADAFHEYAALSSNY